MDTLAKRLIFYRTAARLSQSALAKKSKVSQPVISELESGKALTSKRLPAIAKALGIKLPQLDPEFLGVESVEPIDFARAKVIGRTQAGHWTEMAQYEDDAIEPNEVPSCPGPWSHLKQVAFAVRGSSMELDRIFDGDFVVCVPYFDARPDIRDGDRAVIERNRGGLVERTVKQIEIHGKKVWFCPRSPDPRFHPIKVPLNGALVEDDGTEIRIIALVIGRWSPL